MKKNDPLHVLFLARWYPNRNDPMLGLFVQRHAEAAALFNRVSVIYAEASAEVNSFETEIVTEEEVYTVRVYFPATGKNTPFASLRGNLRYYWAIFTGMRHIFSKQGKPDILHVHVLTRLAIPALVCKWLYNIPYIVTEHWSRYLPLRNEFNGFFRKLLTKIVVKNAGMLTTVTENLREAMKGHGIFNNRMVILPNVVDTDRFKIHGRKDIEKLRMVHVSCFEDKSKNIMGIINAIALLKEHRTDFECVMVGEGMDFEKAVAYARDKGLTEENIHFTGLLEGDILAQTISSAHFLLLFSNYENMPVVILEAFSCGIPVIATRVGGIPEMVNEHNGLLVGQGDEAALVEAIIRMMDTHEQYHANDIRASVTSTYGKAAVGKLLNQWYLEMLPKA